MDFPSANFPITESSEPGKSINSVENFVQGEIFADIFPQMPALTPKKSIKQEERELLSKLPAFRVIRSTRRKRTLHAFRANGLIEIHIPDRLVAAKSLKLSQR